MQMRTSHSKQALSSLAFQRLGNLPSQTAQCWRLLIGIPRFGWNVCVVLCLRPCESEQVSSMRVACRELRAAGGIALLLQCLFCFPRPKWGRTFGPHTHLN